MARLVSVGAGAVVSTQGSKFASVSPFALASSAAIAMTAASVTALAAMALILAFGHRKTSSLKFCKNHFHYIWNLVRPKLRAEVASLHSQPRANQECPQCLMGRFRRCSQCQWPLCWHCHHFRCHPSHYCWCHYWQCLRERQPRRSRGQADARL